MMEDYGWKMKDYIFVSRRGEQRLWMEDEIALIPGGGQISYGEDKYHGRRNCSSLKSHSPEVTFPVKVREGGGRGEKKNNVSLSLVNL